MAAGRRVRSARRRDPLRRQRRRQHAPPQLHAAPRRRRARRPAAEEPDVGERERARGVVRLQVRRDAAPRDGCVEVLLRPAVAPGQGGGPDPRDVRHRPRGVRFRHGAHRHLHRLLRDPPGGLDARGQGALPPSPGAALLALRPRPRVGAAARMGRPIVLVHQRQRQRGPVDLHVPRRADLPLRDDGGPGGEGELLDQLRRHPLAVHGHGRARPVRARAVQLLARGAAPVVPVADDARVVVQRRPKQRRGHRAPPRVPADARPRRRDGRGARARARRHQEHHRQHRR
mmetsp:Transcript_6066/g.19166  ORF Transcript_6066/g.19166 Transcript_6066/m.19166 type:complete len:287 (-) Transcript_6066:735-1595(-)